MISYEKQVIGTVRIAPKLRGKHKLVVWFHKNSRCARSSLGSDIFVKGLSYPDEGRQVWAVF